jgi:hypothetical protein
MYHIKAMTTIFETVYRYYLRLVVPKSDIAIPVEKDIRNWEVRKNFFNYAYYMIHEAWNFIGEDGVCLMIIDFLIDNNSPICFNDNNFARASTPYFK